MPNKFEINHLKRLFYHVSYNLFHHSIDIPFRKNWKHGTILSTSIPIILLLKLPALRNDCWERERERERETKEDRVVKRWWLRAWNALHWRTDLEVLSFWSSGRLLRLNLLLFSMNNKNTSFPLHSSIVNIESPHPLKNELHRFCVRNK